MVPIKKRFAAPYYKLSRIKEQENEFNEALSLLKTSNEIDSFYNINNDVKRILSEQKEGLEYNKMLGKKYVKSLKDLLAKPSSDALITEGLKDLDYVPYNLQIYYLICKAAEKRYRYYELKWAAIEGRRIELHHFGQEIIPDYFLYILGICCKHENKDDEAYEIFDAIVGDDPYRPDEISKKAFEELSELQYLKANK